jgi:hypothetical protein
MSHLNKQNLTSFIEENIIVPFYTSRTSSLRKIHLKDLLKKKNPYLFRSKNITTGQDLVQQMLDAFLSSSEETIFGNLLEKLAVYVCSVEFGGYKPTEGVYKSIDLIFSRDNKTYIVGIKSGSTWGNADSISMMISNLLTTASEKYAQQKVVLVSGICYGGSRIIKHANYTRYIGQEFWELVSGRENFYTEIIDPIASAIKNRNKDFEMEYSRKINEMTKEIFDQFCTDNLLDWHKIVEFNSGK